MTTRRPTRGLLAGLLALLVFASGAVAVTAGGKPAAGTPAQTVAAEPPPAATADADAGPPQSGDPDPRFVRGRGMGGRGPMRGPR